MTTHPRRSSAARTSQAPRQPAPIPPGAALAVSAPVALTPFTPRGLEEALQLADRIAGSGLVPAALRGKPNDVLIILMAGHELGIPPMRALQDLVVIEGKVGMYADAAVAMIVSRPAVCEYFRLVESTAEKATYATKRVGSEEVRLSWTIQQAQRAGLTSKPKADAWRAYPEAMLRHRCALALGRSEYPDLIRNVYDREDDIEEIEINPAPAAKIIPATPRLVTQQSVAQEIASPPEPPPPASELEAQAQAAPTADPLLDEDPRGDDQKLKELLASCREKLIAMGKPESKIDERLARVTTVAEAEALLAKTMAAAAATTPAREPGSDG